MIFQWFFKKLEVPLIFGSGTSKTSGGYAHDELEEFDMLQKVAAAKIQRRSKESFQRPVPQQFMSLFGGTPIYGPHLLGRHCERPGWPGAITRKLQGIFSARAMHKLSTPVLMLDIWGDV